MVYGELGRYSLDIVIKVRTISFWARLISGENYKYTRNLYVLSRQLYDKNFIKCKWLDFVKGILNECGLTYMWEQPFLGDNNSDITWLKHKIKQTLQDQFVQNWYSNVQNSNKAISYRLFKTEFKFEDYLVKLSDGNRIVLSRFRLGCSKLPIERGRYQNIERHRRFCQLCDEGRLGDEFHILLECKNVTLISQRKKLLPMFCQSRPNVVKFCNIMNDDKNLSCLVKYLVHCNRLLG